MPYLWDIAVAPPRSQPLRALLCVLAMATGAQVAAPSAAAQDDTEQAEERARRLYRVGDEHYANGRYEDALAAFEESYELSGRPLLLFNMANAQERLGDYDGAISSLESYLPDAGDDERARIESRIESLRARADRVRRMTEVREQPDEPGISPVGPILIGAGGAALVGALVLALRAKGARDDLDTLCVAQGDRRLCPREAEDAQSRDLGSSIGADILFLAGAASATVGVVLLIKALRSDDETPSADTVDAHIDPSGGYARWTHAF